ncbi:TNT domain-containing protein [Ruania suaedae]|uniref:TNT domain-containing protein n=1 Tax=Ruania suaedae TaxID=2897774 RepID=UPI001E59E011|nr:TNT domain-containing protein [Ruania suaedae]UFU02670.1 TNT domain-containing protein [Ruania suaedae]
MDDLAGHPLIEQVVSMLFDAADAGSDIAGAEVVHLEWSQAGPEHSGRAYASGAQGARWIDVPSAVAPALRDLRAQTARPGAGAWLSLVILARREGRVEVVANYDRRPYWNSATPSMLDTPAQEPVPDERRWAADLRRYPRDREHRPPWLAEDEVSGEAVTQLRQGLDARGVPRTAVVLPGESEDVRGRDETGAPHLPLEGTVEVVRYGARHYGLQVSDYGQHALIGEFYSERAACDAVWQYLTAPMPAPVPVHQAELAERVSSAGPGLAELHRRVAAAGPGGILTNLAAGVPYDRIGTLDGLYFFVGGTPWEQRSLPASARGPGAQVQTFMATRPVEVQAEIAPAWFGQPGGGLRFHVEPPARSLRELIRAGVVQQVAPSP